MRTTAGIAAGLVIGLLVGAGLTYALVQPMNTTQSISSSSSSSSSASTGVAAPVAVTLNPKTTAVLVLDYVFCYRMTGCNATLPAIQAMLTSARSAGVPVIYTRSPVPVQIANTTGDTVITNDIGPDKFLNTSLAAILQGKGITTVVVTGIASNGALLYTAQEACARHLTVVVPQDLVVGTPYVQGYVQYQLLNGPGCGNAANVPLSPFHATLTTSSQIKFSAS